MTPYPIGILPRIFRSNNQVVLRKGRVGLITVVSAIPGRHSALVFGG